MIRPFGLSLLMLTIAGSFGMALQAEAQQVGSLTVEVSELRNQEGNVCLKLFSGSEGFPNDDENALQITCVPIGSTLATAPSDSDTTATATPSPAPSPLAPSPLAPSIDASPSATEPTTATAPSEEPTPAPVNSTATTFRYTFENLPYGNYAVAIYHDRNSNERLNRGLFGMPEEGYGFSNDAPASFGPADFDDAVFDLETADTMIQIKMRYP